MWQATKLLLLLLSAAGLFMMENTPSGLRDNICSWKILYPCPEWFGTAHVDGALQILIWLLIGGLSLSLIMPVVLADYRRTIAFMAIPMASAMPSRTNFLAEQTVPQNEAHDFALANLDEWRNVDPLELWRAGCLWKGFQPHYPIGFNDPAYASYIMLVNAVKAGQLAVTNPGTEVDAWSLVSRGELARFAGTKGNVPEFLRGVAIEGAALSPIRMSVGESGPYFKTDGSIYEIRRTYNLKLENTAQSKPLSNCSIHIMDISPPTHYEGPWLLKDEITLAAGAHTFIPLVTYGEAREPDKYASGDTFATMGTATGRPTLDVGPKYTVTLRATAQNTAFCDFECRVWVDENGRLRIEESLTDGTRQIPEP